MTDHPTEPTVASDNRWEPTAPPPAYPPPSPAPAATTDPRHLPRPGPQFWWAGAAAAAIVLVASAGFLVGRASVDDHGTTPVQIQRQFPQDDDQQFDGQQFGGQQFGSPPGGVPQPQG